MTIGCAVEHVKHNRLLLGVGVGVKFLFVFKNYGRGVDVF